MKIATSVRTGGRWRTGHRLSRVLRDWAQRQPRSVPSRKSPLRADGSRSNDRSSARRRET